MRRNKKMNNLTKQVQNNLVEVGIQDDDIKEILTNNTVLIDNEDAKLLSDIFINYGVSYQYENGIDNLAKITLL
jgi:hypothetical protein